MLKKSAKTVLAGSIWGGVVGWLRGCRSGAFEGLKKKVRSKFCRLRYLGYLCALTLRIECVYSVRFAPNGQQMRGMLEA